MSMVPEILAEGLQHHQANRLSSAEQYYLEVIRLEPGHAKAWHLSGLVAHQNGQHSVAIERIFRAIELNGDDAAFHNDLGIVYYENRNWDLAEAAFRRALQIAPNDASAYCNLGNVFKSRGEFDDAIICYEKAISISAELAAGHFNLGVVLVELGRFDRAIVEYRKALDLNPAYAEAYCNLGSILHASGRIEEAIACLQKGLKLVPDSPDLHNNLGTVLKDQGRHAEAVGHFVHALQLRPDCDLAHNNIGSLHLDQLQVTEAIERFQKALLINPSLAEAYANLGAAYRSRGELFDALTSCRKAVELKPCHAESWNNLGNVFKDLGRVEEAMPCYQRALQLKPGFAIAHSNLLFSMQYRVGVTLADLFRVHSEFDSQHGGWPQVTLTDVDRDPGRPLRIGFVSSDFGQHPVGLFLIHSFENLDPRKVITVCYSDRPIADSVTLRFKASASVWRDVAGLNDEALVNLIVADRIDILIDLAGHTAQNRLMVFARKPAPVQVTWIGYEGTTGLRAIDYILADKFTVPTGSEPFYCERVIRFANGYVCYETPFDAPDVTLLPALENGYLRFGCFNNPAKINSTVIEAWSTILKQVPRSVLVLKYAGLESEFVRSPLIAQFAENGIESSRVEFQPFGSRPDYFASLGNIDLALDPFPFGGAMTTCDALWMGVPVIAMAGETFASRHGMSHLANVGLTGTIALSVDEYVSHAVSLASDWDALTELRATLRPRMRLSTLCDGRKHAEELMSILRTIWMNWIESRPNPRHVAATINQFQSTPA